MNIINNIIGATLFASMLSPSLANAFEVEGSTRVPTYVPRNLDLRDKQSVRVRIVKVEDYYKKTEKLSGATTCRYETHVYQPTDNRGWLSMLINPRSQNGVREQQYNCYNTPKVDSMKVWTGYMVTYELYGRQHQHLMYNKPYGKYITIKQ